MSTITLPYVNHPAAHLLVDGKIPVLRVSWPDKSEVPQIRRMTLPVISRLTNDWLFTKPRKK